MLTTTLRALFGEDDDDDSFTHQKTDTPFRLHGRRPPARSSLDAARCESNARDTTEQRSRDIAGEKKKKQVKPNRSGPRLLRGTEDHV